MDYILQCSIYYPIFTLLTQGPGEKNLEIFIWLIIVSGEYKSSNFAAQVEGGFRGPLTLA